LGALNGAQGTVYTLPATDFHDIISGSNGGYNAGAGYDAVTGLGSPLANLVIQHLVNGNGTSSAAPVSSSSGLGGVGSAAVTSHGAAANAEGWDSGDWGSSAVAGNAGI